LNHAAAIWNSLRNAGVEMTSAPQTAAKNSAVVGLTVMRGANAKESEKEIVMIKNKLLVAAAVAALSAGSGLALAQGTNPSSGAQKDQGSQGSMSSPQNRSTTGAGAQNGSTTGAGERSETKGSETRDSLDQKGSNARGAQGEQRKSETPDDKRSNARGAQGPDRSKSGTTGQAPSQSQNQPSQGQNQMQNRSGQTTGQGAQQPSTSGQAPAERGTTSQQPGTPQGQQPGAQGQGQTGGQTGTSTSTSVQLNTQQRTQISQVVLQQRNVPRVSNANFSISVGAVVPRTVQFVDVPEEVIRIHPAFRRHKIFLVREEIVIVEPETLKIVAVIPAHV